MTTSKLRSLHELEWTNSEGEDPVGLAIVCDHVIIKWRGDVYDILPMPEERGPLTPAPDVDMLDALRDYGRGLPLPTDAPTWRRLDPIAAAAVVVHLQEQSGDAD